MKTALGGQNADGARMS